MARKTTKKTKKSNIITIVFIGLVVLSLFVLFLAPKGKSSGSEAELAQCLVDAGYVMGGTSWCSHCKAQKELFKGAFESIIIPGGGYKDCDLDTEWCTEAGIEGFPTWVTPEGNLLPGRQQLSTLSKIAGC